MREREIARFMLDKIDEDGMLYQRDAVTDIEERFGPEHIYQDAQGNDCISKDVLAEFNELTKTTVVWEKVDRAWRYREPGDPPGRAV